MAGRHDRADAAGPLHTGPIMVRGLARGVRAAVRTGRTTRHRAAAARARDDSGAVHDEDPTMEDGVRDEEAVPEDMSSRPEADARYPAEDGEPEAGGPAETDGPSETDGAASDPAPDDVVEDAGRDGDGGATAAQPSGGAAAGAVRIAGPAGRRPHRHISRESAGIAVLAVLAVVCAALVVAVVLKTQRDAALAAQEAASYTPPPLTSQTPAAAAAVAVIGDGSLTAAAPGVDAADRWPALLDDRLQGGVRTIARPGAGYTVARGTAGTLVDAVPDVPISTRAVVFVGGAADVGAAPLTLARAASRALSDAAVRAPGARLVVVGPLYRSTGVSTTQLAAVRDVLRSTAALADATWIDPVERGWTPDVREASDLTGARQTTIATRMAAALKPVLAAGG